MEARVVGLKLPRQPGASSPTISTSKSVRASAAAHSESEHPSKVPTSVFPPNFAYRPVSNGWPLAYRAFAADAEAGRTTATTASRARAKVNPVILERLTRITSPPLRGPLLQAEPTEGQSSLSTSALPWVATRFAVK